MQVKCHLMAMGKYKDEVRDYLEHAPDFYAHADEKTIVFAKLFEVTGEAMVRGLCDILKADPFQPQTHRILPTTPHHASLKAFDEHDYPRLTLLAKHGFAFFLRIEW